MLTIINPEVTAANAPQFEDDPDALTWSEVAEAWLQPGSNVIALPAPKATEKG